MVRIASPIQRTNLVLIIGYLLAKKLPNFCARMSENGNTFFYTKTAIITMLLNSLHISIVHLYTTFKGRWKQETMGAGKEANVR